MFISLSFLIQDVIFLVLSIIGDFQLIFDILFIMLGVSKSHTFFFFFSSSHVFKFNTWMFVYFVGCGTNGSLIQKLYCGIWLCLVNLVPLWLPLVPVGVTRMDRRSFPKTGSGLALSEGANMARLHPVTTSLLIHTHTHCSHVSGKGKRIFDL